jgi:tetratricopeptide (TPR) repeat protein/transcriptional regulator with XRE-family HTH domain
VRTNWTPLPEDLTAPARELTERLRALKDTHGLTLAELGSRTHYTRSSWERWLNGKRLVTASALRSLGEALGVDPAPLLTLLERAADATQAPGSEGGPGPAQPARAAQSPSAAAPLAQLPADVADFSGRAPETRRLLRTLAASLDGPGKVPVSTVIGGGGLGKTTLAVHVAHQAAQDFPDGQLYIDLRGADPVPREPADVLAFFLNAFGIPTGELPGDIDERAALFRTVLSGRRVLIVLDNAREPAQIRPLIPATQGCAVLVTSRDKLSGLAGAHRLDLELLPTEDARNLLARIIGADRAALEPEAVDAILGSCAGLPLAVRIAGARLVDRPTWSLEWFATRLANRRRRLDELSVSDLAVRACFELSYAYLLAPAADREGGHGKSDAARVFRSAALIPASSFDADEVAALLGDPDAELGDALEHLVNIHLLNDHGDGRYMFHDLVRSYALRLLEESESAEERDRALRRLLGWYASGVEAASVAIDGAVRALPVLEPEPGTPHAPRFASRDAASAWCRRHVAALSGAIDAARPCGRPDLAARIAAHSMSYIHVDMTVDWMDWLQRALAAQEGVADLTYEAWLRHRIGVCHGMWERPEQCVAELEHALRLHRECGDRLAELKLLQNLVLGYGLAQDHEKALEAGALALARFHEYPEPERLPRFEARAHSGMGDSYLSNLQYQEAIDHYLRAIEQFGPGNRDRVLSLGSLGDAYRGLGLFEEAVACLEESLDLAAEIGDRFLQADGLHILGRVYDHFGNQPSAAEHWRQSLAAFEAIGFAPGVDRVRASLAALPDAGAEAGATAEDPTDAEGPA